MKILLVNPPYQTITSNFGVGHQIPLGLLMIGGPLIDAGHDVRLLDAECRRLSVENVVREVAMFEPDIVMTGHAGSTPAHPVCMEMLRAIKSARPAVITVYGGVYPTYHAKEILGEQGSIQNRKSQIQNAKALTPSLSRSTGRGGRAAALAVDIIVRGEGEAAAVEIAAALPSSGRHGALSDRLAYIPGIAF